MSYPDRITRHLAALGGRPDLLSRHEDDVVFYAAAAGELIAISPAWQAQMEAGGYELVGTVADCKRALDAAGWRVAA